MKNGKFELSATQDSVKGLAIFFAIVVVVGVVGYSEVMFLAVISKSFPDGLLKPVAMAGGVATGLSVLTLLLSKAYWFRPGHQLTWSYLFTGLEVVILILNVLLSFALSNGPLKGSDPMYTWYTLCPSSPIFALVGWTVLIMLDRSQKERHDRMELEDKQRKLELRHENDQHAALMDLRSTMLNSQVAHLKQHMESPEVQETIRLIAHDLAAQELSNFAGQYVAAMRHQPSAGTVQDSIVGPPSVSAVQLPAIGHGPVAQPPTATSPNTMPLGSVPSLPPLESSPKQNKAKLSTGSDA